MPRVKFELFAAATVTGNACTTSGSALSTCGATGTSACSCTTDAAGTCTIAGVPAAPGGTTYCLVEDATTVPSGYAADPTFPRAVTVYPGQAVDPAVSVVNPRTHKVIVLVCHEGSTPRLYANGVTVNGTAMTSLAAAGLPSSLSTLESTLCGLGGATVGGLAHGASFTGTATIATH